LVSCGLARQCLHTSATKPHSSSSAGTDGPPPETSDLVAGWYMIDVESHERAVELAAYVSRNSRLTERLHRLALPSYDPIEPSNSSLVSSDQWAARSRQPIGNRETP
jgi:hypothetical protein